MVRYLAIPGTGNGKRTAEGKVDWDHPHSLFASFLRARGFVPLVDDDPARYGWDGALDGIDGYDLTWDLFGKALYHYFVPPLFQQQHLLAPVYAIPPRETFIIAHSHAGNVVANACGKYGLKVQGLVTVGMPIQKKLYPLYEAAAANIGVHLHLHAGWRDYMQILGSFSLSDFTFGVHREHPFATCNRQMPKGHGNILREPDLFPLWESEGWLAMWAGQPTGRMVEVS